MRRLLIGLAGFAGCGKDTAAHYLALHHAFHPLAFADPLRDMLAALLANLGMSEADARRAMHDRARKEIPLLIVERSPRQLLQTLGTEWGRELVVPDIWIRIARHRARQAGNRNVVFTDVRFPDEAAFVRNAGGVVWRLTRNERPSVLCHVSEYALPADLVDAEIDNNGTFEQLFERLEHLVDEQFNRATALPSAGPVGT